mmetsp:Transcript_69/g.161  ORF Transcript_69/g.161 Transcript_69/m.161 type:complete len:88 (-) Transcript_69:832-1095(-)
MSNALSARALLLSETGSVFFPAVSDTPRGKGALLSIDVYVGSVDTPEAEPILRPWMNHEQYFDRQTARITGRNMSGKNISNEKGSSS